MDERFERVDLGGEYHHRIEVRGRNGEMSITELDTYSTGLAARMSTERARELAKAIERATGLDPAPPEPPAAVLARLDGTSLLAIAEIVRDAVEADRDEAKDLADTIAEVLTENGREGVRLYTEGQMSWMAMSAAEFGAWLAERLTVVFEGDRE